MSFLVSFVLIFFLLRSTAKQTIEELVKSNGFCFETHHVKTKDGYVLGVHRMFSHQSNGKKKKTILLQHGLLDSSITWLLNLRNQSLGYILADNGFDVWLGNVRGNEYSLQHERLSSKDKKFWEFTWVDMFLYDIPAMVQYISNITSAPLHCYIGHSQGTLIGFNAFSSSQFENLSVSLFVGLAPVYTVGHIKGAFAVFAKFADDFPHYLETGQFPTGTKFMNWLGEHMCALKSIDKYVCENILFLFTGFDPNGFNRSRIPMYLSYEPSTTSCKNLVHFSQMVKSKTCQNFDYGSEQLNMLHYNQSRPPVFRLTNFKIPSALFWSANDWLAGESDITLLLNEIRSSIILEKKLLTFNHLDFLWSNASVSNVYDEILKLL